MASPTRRTYRPVRAASELPAARRLSRARRAGQDRRDALLFLRDAMRHQAAGQQQQGRRFRALGRVPYNQGRLCPKGVQRYLQNNHPDRLLHPLERAEGAGFQRHRLGARAQPHGFEIRRIQRQYGPDAFAMLSGVSLTNEKSYLVGKFRPNCAQDAQSRLQWSALHGQRRRGKQESVRPRSRLE